MKWLGFDRSCVVRYIQDSQKQFACSAHIDATSLPKPRSPTELKMQNVRIIFRFGASLPLLAMVGLTQASDFNDRQAIALSDKLLSALVETNGVVGMGAAVWRDGVPL